MATTTFQPPTNRRTLPYSLAGSVIRNARKKYGSGAGTGTSKAADTPSYGSTTIDTEPLWLKTAPSMNDGENSVSSANNYYKDLLKEQQKAANAQMQAALDANNAYIPQVNTYADKQLQNAYILKEQNRVNLPQQLSALGYSGGATETSMLGEMTDYKNSRNDIETDRNEALNNIYQNAAQIRSTGNANLADLSAQYYQNMIAKQQQDKANKSNDIALMVAANSNDYMAKINQLRAQGYSDNSEEIMSLLAARNDKLANQARAKSEAEQQAFDNYVKNAQLQYNINKPYFKPTSNSIDGMSDTEYMQWALGKATSGGTFYQDTYDMLMKLRYGDTTQSSGFGDFRQASGQY